MEPKPKVDGGEPKAAPKPTISKAKSKKQSLPNEDDDFEKLIASGASLDSLIPTDLSGTDKIVHADDALDFESEDELADEEIEETNVNTTTDADADAGAAEEDDDWTGAFAEELGLVATDGEADMLEEEPEAEEEPVIEPQSELERTLAQLHLYYPDFKPHAILKMNKLFGPKPMESQLAAPPRAFRACVPQRMRLDPAPDQAALFETEATRMGTRQRITELPAETVSHPSARVSADQLPGVSQRGRVVVTNIEEEFPEFLDAEDIETERLESVGLPTIAEMKHEELALATADWDHVLDDDPESKDDIMAHRPPSPPPTSKRARVDFAVIEKDVYGSDDEDAILEGSYQLAKARPLVDMNDPHLLFVEGRSSHIRFKNLEPRYNISNDRAYDMLKENYQKKVRSTIGSLNIDHSMVAQRLQTPFYKVSLPKQQLRSWHRPKFNIKPGTVIELTPLKRRKRRKDKAKTLQQLLGKSSDLSLGDNAAIFLIEYSEETPLVLNDFGMGSKLINYYRKKDADDTIRPKLELGETHVLDVQDRSAFWNFGFVEPGNMVPTLYNQMIRAPVFQHDPRSTDFLLVRSTTKARGQRYFLRPIPYLFVAGQTFPVTLIPGPHARKVTAASKNRLKMIVYRVLNKDPHHRLQVRDISAHFPDQNDMQNRQRLKEFMEYQRSGEDQGFWKVKQTEILPNEENIRQMITPEDVALLESMQQGQQHLDDSGYSKSVDDDDKEQDEEGQTFEEQLAPWNISKNFVNAIQGKAMLQLHGEGDPTGRGEGFSFLRTSMKGGFKAGGPNTDLEEKLKLGGHSYNVALQQKAYDEEIKRIWYAQARSLKITDPKKLPPQKIQGPSQEEQRSRKVLKITRIIRDANGILQRRTEVVTNPGVIRAYIKRRQQMEEEKMAVDDIAVTDDAEANKQKLKFLENELARLNRNLDRRQARKATKDSDTSKSRATTRKCATCGAVGHIKTNKSCPMYNDIYLGGQPQKS